MRVTPERELMGRGQQRRVRPVRGADHGAAAVDGQRPQAQALRLRRGRGGPGGHRPPRRAWPRRPAQRGAGDGQAVREARADHDAVRIGGHAPGPGQVAGQRRPQPRQPARIRVVEELAGGGGEHLAGSRQPRAAGKGGQVRHTRAQVVAGSGDLGAGQRARAGIGGAAFGDGGPRAGPGGQPTLRDQLAVDLGHRVAGEAEVRGQGAGRRQPCARAETADPDRVAQRRLSGRADSNPGP